MYLLQYRPKVRAWAQLSCCRAQLHFTFVTGLMRVGPVSVLNTAVGFPQALLGFLRRKLIVFFSTA